jgi:predicted O-linked N-acetylglucosamine transferase (SPINDLY family)
LTRISLKGWVAESQDQYVGIGIKLAQDINAIENLRADLRSRMQSSDLCDGRSFARIIEKSFQKLWQNCCQENDQNELFANGT